MHILKYHLQKILMQLVCGPLLRNVDLIEELLQLK